ncbi:MAG: HAD family hydrolase [bacterium]|nr:HAD family hydrolase [bacterium]
MAAERRFDALFVDFYGTLTSGDKRAVEDTCELVVGQLGLDVAGHELAVSWGQRFFKALERANDGAFRDLFTLECETLVETLGPTVGAFDPTPFVTHLKGYWGAPELQPETVEALAAVAAMGIPVCCVSNADTEDLLGAVEKHKLKLEHIVTSEDARSYKPDAGVFRQALGEMKVASERVMHVGDSLYSDVSGAQALGIEAAWICREERIFDLGKAHPDHKIRSLLELPSLLA